MPSQDDIASTIDELARKLDDVPAEEIREELQRYVDHGVPLHQAKKDIENSLSSSGGGSATPSEPVERKAGEITTDDENVDLTARIVSVAEREITARGEEKTIWSGTLGDETGVVSYTAWRKVDLEPDTVVRIENAYVTEWQDDPQVNIGDHAQVERVDEEIQVPSAADRSEEQTVSDLEDGMGSVSIEGRVLSKSSREVTVQGEETTLWEGEIADASGKIPYTAWHDHGFGEGDVLRIDNGYVRSFRGTPQLNFGENADVEQLDDDAVPPASQLADVEGPTMETTEQQIADLEPEMSSVSVTGRVLSVGQREITARGEPTTLWEGEIADASGKIPYTAWDDMGIEEGDVLRIEDGYVREFRGTPQLNFGENAAVERVDDDTVPSATELADVEGPALSTTEHEVRELKPDMSSVTITGRVLSVDQREIQARGEPTTLWEGEIADASGRIPYTAWDDMGIEEDDILRIENGYVRSFRGLPQLNFGENAEVTHLDDDELPPTSELSGLSRVTVEELQAARGAVGIEVEGVVVEVRDGSGLILRCPECRRVLQDKECRQHGRVEGIADLRVKAVVDDGTGAVIALFDRSTTERLLGKSLEECEAEAEEEMTFDVIDDQVDDEILMQRVRLGGNATHDEYGTSLMVNEFDVLEAENLEEQAEAMIERVEAVSQEVAA